MALKTLLMLTVFGIYLPNLHAAPITVDLTQFSSGVAGGRFIGPASSNTGTSLSQAGDHNGDGFDDFVFSSALLAKAVIVMKGNSTYSELDIANIVSDQYFRVITGPTGSNLGSCVGGIGDINDDGFDDVLIGARTAEVSGRGAAGFAFALFGMKGPFTDIAVAADWIASTIGFVLLGPSSTSLFVGINQSGRGLGDVNDDGVDDFALSARWYPGTTGRNNAGTVFVIFGKTTPAFTNIDLLLVPDNFGSSHGVYFTGSAISDNFGIAVKPAGDFNGDGIADFLIGATGFDPPAVNSVARANAGAVYLVHGSATNLVNTDMLNFVTGSRGVRFLGAAAADAAGNDHGGVGDINGDGIDDIAIGAPYADTLSRSNAGAVYVIYGTTSVFSADVDLLSFVTSSSFGFAIYGRAMDMLLSTIAPAGDINRDGANDILLGGGGGTSRAHLIPGQTTARTTPVDTLTDDVLTFYLTDGAFLGLSLDGGDFNGDGNPDILLSGFRAAVTPESNTSATLAGAGAVWMISGLSLFPSPTANPSAAPSIVPSILPSAMPSFQPSIQPSLQPSIQPSIAPSNTDPTIDPTIAPSAYPSFAPSEPPSVVPSVGPSAQPSQDPSAAPSANPSFSPSARPSVAPSLVPTTQPSLDPTLAPTADPSVKPSTQPSLPPSLSPSTSPSAVPSMDPSAAPSAAPTLVPTASPTIDPTARPTAVPTVVPSLVPTMRPTSKQYQVVLVVEQVEFLQSFRCIRYIFLILFSCHKLRDSRTCTMQPRPTMKRNKLLVTSPSSTPWLTRRMESFLSA